MSQPFFIVGFQRSGTTLLRLMLDNHPGLAIPLDTVGLWARYEDRLPDYHHLASAADRRRLVEDLIQEERIRLWEVPLTADGVLSRITLEGYPGIVDAFHRCYAAARGKTDWGDKDPGNMTRIARLNRWFPRCRIIHIVRDGRDACLSQLEQDFGFDDLLECACAWREQVWWTSQIGAVMGRERYLELRYEDLVAEPERKLREICDLLQVGYDPDMLQYHRAVAKSVPESKRHLWPLLDRPPQKDNADRWRREMSPGMRICFEKRAHEALREFGYETLPTPSGAYWQELRSLMASAWRAGTRRFRTR